MSVSAAIVVALQKELLLESSDNCQTETIRRVSGVNVCVCGREGVSVFECGCLGGAICCPAEKTPPPVFLKSRGYDMQRLCDPCVCVYRCVCVYVCEFRRRSSSQKGFCL